MRTDVELQNFLADLTEAMLVDPNLTEALAQYDERDVRQWSWLVIRLRQSLTPVQPSPRFVRQLRADLMGNRQRNMLVRVRRLPPRVQIAAGIALVAGFMILSRRRVQTTSAPSEAQETAHAQ
jgi:hypothetical protein